MTYSYTTQKQPAQASAIDTVCDNLKIKKNSWLADFWKKSDGAVIDDQIIIYSTQEIEERNKTYEIAKNFPLYILIGDDSSGRLILSKKNNFDNLYLIDAGSPFIEDAKKFNDIENIAIYLSQENSDLNTTGRIISIAEITPKPSEVLRIKKDLALSFSIRELSEMLQTKNSTIVQDITLVKHQKTLDDLNHLIKYIPG